MNVEFYQDDNGKIYLFHASDIYVREAKKATRAQKKKMEEQQTSVKKKRVEKQSEEELEMEAVQKEVEGLQEITVFNRSGVAAYSTVPGLVKTKLPPKPWA